MLRRHTTPALIAALGLVALLIDVPVAASVSAAPVASAAPHAYIVQVPGGAGAASAAVSRAGGRVLTSLPIIGAVDAELAGPAVRALSGQPGVRVTPDLEVAFAGQSYGPGAGTAPAQLAAMDLAGHWSPNGGAGVGVAVIDTGVSLTPGLTASRVVRSPDFSGEGSVVDGFGHGTFMAGLVAGNGIGGPNGVPGVAPGATLVAVKVAAADGSTDLSKVIEGIGWAVANRDAYNIRVMSISLEADIPVAPSLDPLDAAVEAAWASGIAVVAAAGNEGAGVVTAPGDDPWVITVGAETTAAPLSSPSWSGTSATKPDILAPGVEMTSLRDAGSTIDQAYPAARVGGLYFRGSGTSMATAVTAGAAALLIQDHPAATPDDIKAALTSGSVPAVPGAAGSIDLARSDVATAAPSWWQSHPIAFDGLGGNLGTVMPWATGTWTPASWATDPSGPVTWSSIPWSTLTWSTMRWATTDWATMRWATMRWATMRWATQSWG